MRLALFPILGLIAAGGLAAQQGSLTGPVEAYTFDAPTRSLRAVIGFPGAASFGPALRDSLDFASVAPLQNYGIGFQRGRCLLIANLGSTALAARTLEGVDAQPEGIAWSGDGSLAVLYSRTGNWLQTVTGFPGSPVAEARVALGEGGSSLGGVLASVAIDVKGKQIAIGLSGDTGAVYVSSDGRIFTNLKTVAQPIALTFSTDGLTLYALEGSAPQVFAITLSNHAYQNIPLTGLAAPVAIQGAEDSQSRPLLYVASSSDRVLRIVDVASQQIVTTVALSFQPTSLDQFGSNSFVVAARSQAANPLWLFTNTPQPGAYFVPAIEWRHPGPSRQGFPGGVR